MSAGSGEAWCLLTPAPQLGFQWPSFWLHCSYAAYLLHTH